VLAEFFTWWRQNLLELVPETLRRGTNAQANALVVDAASPGTLILQRRRRGVEARAGQIRLDEPGLVSLRAALNQRLGGEPVILRLPASALLERPVTLPVAAERDPERVLGYEMERLTPFTADEVYWGYHIESRDRTRNRLSLRLTYVPRSQVNDLIDALTGGGGRPSLIEAQTASGPRTIRLQHDRPTGRMAVFTDRNIGIALAGLAFLVLVSPFLRQSLDMQEAQGRLDALQPRIHVVDELRRRIAGAGAGGEAVISENRRVGDMLGALAAITEILPDDSYLTEFTMRERKMTLSGMSVSAPKLISALSSDARVKNPAFNAAVTRDAKGLDVFTIRADWAQ
jgi:general secretion pathway protein L